ncbi:MAG: mandelate racemase/muconate lactonizing enzyme family protein [Planctomycetaceae bacterium]|nr:mandelate racemase/muconate lactonizing enzyme family protein [Planctomycetaceae bacterium]
MKIREIHVHRLVGATVDGGWPAGHEPQDDLHALIEVVADDGLVGWGSVFTGYRLVEAGVEFLRPQWLHESAVEPERVSEKLRQSSFWQGRGGTVEHVISGIDIALWDLFGKVCQQPVSRLLGGNYRARIKPYGSILFDEPARLRDTLAATVARGFRAIKLGWRPFGRVSSRYDELLVRTARETVGPEIELLVDAGGSEEYWPHGYKWALHTARMLAQYDIGWFEEPLPPDDIEGYIRLREAAPLPIAGGEVLTRRQAFLPWIERGAVDILQPDATKCGGLSEARRIAWAAYDHNVGFVSHGWNTGVGVAADLQLAAAIPVARFVEYLTPAAYIEEILTEPFQLDAEGFLPIPQKPGLGIEIDRAALARFSGRK